MQENSFQFLPRAFNIVKSRALISQNTFLLKMDGWVTFDFTHFSKIFQSYQEINNKRLYAMEPRLQLRRFRLDGGSNSGPLDH